jgi:hypothetical protein
MGTGVLDNRLTPCLARILVCSSPSEASTSWNAFSTSPISLNLRAKWRGQKIYAFVNYSLHLRHEKNKIIQIKNKIMTT